MIYTSGFVQTQVEESKMTVGWWWPILSLWKTGVTCEWHRSVPGWQKCYSCYLWGGFRFALKLTIPVFPKSLFIYLFIYSFQNFVFGPVAKQEKDWVFAK